MKQAYNGTDLPLKLGRLGGKYDVQWHTAPGFTVTNKARTTRDGGTRRITGTVGRSAQSEGEYVCKYGRATYYTCGYIDSKDFRPDKNVVPNPAATFIRVDNTAPDYDDLSDGGDSGGPWFLVNDAYGVHHGAPSDDLNDAIYMAVNYISPALNVDVMTAP